MELTKEVAYLLGALRDGSVFYNKSSRNYTVVWYEKNKQWLNLSIASRVNKLFKKRANVYEYKPNQNRVRISSMLFFSALKNEFGFVSPQEKWDTPKRISSANDKIISIYIAGFFDAEGDIGDYQIGFSQKNEESLNFIKIWLRKKGITSSRIFVADKKSGTKRFYITSNINFKTFREIVPFEHPEKIKKMNALLQHT